MNRLLIFGVYTGLLLLWGWACYDLATGADNGPMWEVIGIPVALAEWSLAVWLASGLRKGRS